MLEIKDYIRDRVDDQITWYVIPSLFWRQPLSVTI